MTASSYCLVSPNKKGHLCPWKNVTVIPLSTPEPHALFPFKAAPLWTDYIISFPRLYSCLPAQRYRYWMGVILRHVVLKVKAIGNPPCCVLLHGNRLHPSDAQQSKDVNPQPRRRALDPEMLHRATRMMRRTMASAMEILSRRYAFGSRTPC